MAAMESIQGADVAASMGLDQFQTIVQAVSVHANGGAAASGM